MSMRDARRRLRKLGEPKGGCPECAGRPTLAQAGAPEAAPCKRCGRVPATVVQHVVVKDRADLERARREAEAAGVEVLDFGDDYKPRR